MLCKKTACNNNNQ